MDALVGGRGERFSLRSGRRRALSRIENTSSAGPLLWQGAALTAFKEVRGARLIVAPHARPSTRLAIGQPSSSRYSLTTPVGSSVRSSRSKTDQPRRAPVFVLQAGMEPHDVRASGTGRRRISKNRCAQSALNRTRCAAKMPSAICVNRCASKGRGVRGARNRSSCRGWTVRRARDATRLSFAGRRAIIGLGACAITATSNGVVVCSKEGGVACPGRVPRLRHLTAAALKSRAHSHCDAARQRS